MQTNLKKNSNFFERILQVIEIYGIKNVPDLAKNYLNYKSPEKLYRLQEENTKPSVDILLDFSNKFEDLNMNWFISGKGDPKKDFNTSNSLSFSEKRTAYNNKIPLVVTVDSQDRENIPLVPVKARAGYLDGYYKPEFVKNLPVYRMPGLNNGTFRMFQMKGQSMNLTIPDKSFAVGEFVENWITGIKDDRVYIVITSDWDRDEEGVIIKRCLNRIKKYNNLLCKSDNLDRRSYPTKNIDPETILEVWEVKGAFIIDIPNPATLFDRMNENEAEIEQLKQQINKIISQ